MILPDLRMHRADENSPFIHNPWGRFRCGGNWFPASPGRTTSKIGQEFLPAMLAAKKESRSGTVCIQTARLIDLHATNWVECRMFSQPAFHAGWRTILAGPDFRRIS